MEAYDTNPRKVCVAPFPTPLPVSVRRIHVEVLVKPAGSAGGLGRRYLQRLQV